MSNCKQLFGMLGGAVSKSKKILKKSQWWLPDNKINKNEQKNKLTNRHKVEQRNQWWERKKERKKESKKVRWWWVVGSHSLESLFSVALKGHSLTSDGTLIKTRNCFFLSNEIHISFLLQIKNFLPKLKITHLWRRNFKL